MDQASFIGLIWPFSWTAVSSWVGPAYFISVASALSTAICYGLTDKWIYIINSSQEVTIKIYFWNWEIAQKCLSIWDFGRKVLQYLSGPRTKLELLLFCFSSLNYIYIGLEQMNVNSLISNLWTVWVVQLFRNVKIHTLNGEISSGDRNYILIILLLSEITSCLSLLPPLLLFLLILLFSLSLFLSNCGGFKAPYFDFLIPPSSHHDLLTREHTLWSSFALLSFRIHASCHLFLFF